jgi:Mitochondrial carrier protein
LNDFFDVYDDVQPMTLMASNLIVGLALSPLELVRTRLVIQSGSAHRKKYSGAFHALYVIYNEERPSPSSVILGTFYHPRVLLPSFLIYSISPIIRYLSTSFIENELGYDSTFTPIMYNLCQLGMLAIEAFVTAPLELARSRIFAQRIDGKISHVDNCIETSHQSYSTPFDCLQKVVIQEGGRRKTGPKNSKISADDWQNIYGGGSTNPGESDGLLFKIAGYGQGLASCFRGFAPRYCALVVRYISQEINKEEF